jgi:hypothetical protein
MAKELIDQEMEQLLDNVLGVMCGGNEREKVRQVLRDYLIGPDGELSDDADPEIREFDMKYNKGEGWKMEATLAGARVRRHVETIVEFFVERNPPNYLWTAMFHPKVGQLEMILRRVSGKSDHEMRTEAEAHLRAVLGIVDAIGLEGRCPKRKQWREVVAQAKKHLGMD